MRRAALAALFVTLIAAGGWIYLFAPGPFAISWPDRTEAQDIAALDALPQRALAPMIEGADLVIFQDGDEGWFELDTAALPANTQIGFYGPRIFDVLTGNDHIPLYCGGGTARAGKILRVVRDGRTTQDFAFCNPRRMDLRPLRTGATPVEMVRDDLPRAELLTRIADITDDPSRALVDQPDSISHLTHRVTIELPLYWWDRGPFFDWDDRLLATIHALAPDQLEATLRLRGGVNTNISIPSEEGQPDYPSAQVSTEMMPFG